MDKPGLIAKIKENAITLVVLIVAVIIAFKIYRSKEIELQNTLNQKADEVQKNAVLVEIGSLENKLDNLRKNFNAQDPTAGMEKIGDLAKSALVRITKINPLTEITSGVYTKFPYEMSLLAKDYHQVGKFISLLENSPDNYMVENLVINSNAAGDSGLTISASLTVYTITVNK